MFVGSRLIYGEIINTISMNGR